MTRVCAACGAVLSEKCSRCGAEASPIGVNTHGHPIPGTQFVCVNPACGWRFGQGEGGETQELCQGCLLIAKRKAAGL